MTTNPRDGTVPGRLAACAATRPDEVAHIVVGGDQLTFREWDARSNAAARGLAAEGVGSGDRVVLLCDRGDWINYAIAYAATTKLGAVAVPVARSASETDLRLAITAAEAAAVVGDDALSLSGPRCVTLSALEKGQSTAPLDIEVDPDQDAEILLTSGTTGLPKCVVATHRALLHSHSTRSGATRVILHAMPPGTLAGQGLLLQALDGTRRRVVTLPRYGDSALVAAIHEYRPHHLIVVPAFAISLTQSAAAADLDSSSVRMVRSTSAPIPPVVLKRLASLFPRAEINNHYGTTETGPGLQMKYDPTRPDAVGQVGGRVSIRIVDDRGDSRAVGIAGHVELSVPAGARRRSLRELAPREWIRTGDTGRLDADGFLYLLDRDADVINTGGLKVSSLRVEAALMEFEGVLEAAVVGLPHEILWEYVVAALRAGPDLDHKALDSFLYERLGAHEVPRRVLVMDELPKNALGKVVKTRLREQLSREIEKAASAVTDAPHNELHERVRQIWSEAFAMDQVAWGADFLTLGGTSLTAVEIIDAIRDELGRDVREHDLYAAGTLATFAERVEAAGHPVTVSRELALSSPSGVLPPATPRQVWHYNAVNGGESFMSVSVGLRLRRLDRRSLQLALDDLVARHEALRTVLVRTDADEVWQLVGDALHLPLEDAPGGIVPRPFMVRGGRLVRARLREESATDDVLVLTVHHAVADGWSAHVLLRDLVELYRARCEERTPDLPGMRMQFGDYATEAREAAEQEPGPYWRERLGMGHPPLAIGTPESETSAHFRAWRLSPVSARTMERIRSLAVALRTTEARVIWSAVLAAVSPLWATAEPTIGIYVANRDRAELRDVVGELTDVLPIPMDLSGDPPLTELTRRVSDAVADALDHRLPLVALADLIRGNPVRRTGPLVDLTLNYLPPWPGAADRLDWPGRAEIEPAAAFADHESFSVDRWWDALGHVDIQHRPRDDGGVDGQILTNVTTVPLHVIQGLIGALNPAIERMSREPETRVSQLFPGGHPLR